jgi:Sec-independent protein translocase protein TatA
MGISTLILVVLIALLVWAISRIGRVEAPRPQR